MERILKSKMYVALLFYFLFYSGLGRAQILNVEDPAIPLDSLKSHDLRMAVSASGNVARQSAWVYDLTLLSEVVYHHEDRHQMIIQASWQSTGSNREILLRSGVFYLRITPGFHKRLSPQFFAQRQTDLGRGLQSRQLVGLNARWDMIKMKKYSLQAILGMMREQELWNRTGDASDASGSIFVNTLKLNTVTRLFLKPTENLEITWSNFIQTPLTGATKGMRWASQLGLTQRILKRLNAQFNFSSMYDTQPIVPIPSYYFNTSSGLTYNIP